MLQKKEMTDIYSKQKRSQIMSKISGKNTKPEIIIRKISHSLGYRFRLHKKDLPGKPDIVFPKYKKLIFVNGCFWHGHKNCKRSKLPTTNKKFWKEKIEGNKKKDQSNYYHIKKLGWDYLIIWQCVIKISNRNKLEKKIQKFLDQ
jgi:DNA mismatch endonuclease (patch repair protein)